MNVEHIPCIATRQPSASAVLSDIFKCRKDGILIALMRTSVSAEFWLVDHLPVAEACLNHC